MEDILKVGKRKFIKRQVEEQEYVWTCYRTLEAVEYYRTLELEVPSRVIWSQPLCENVPNRFCLCFNTPIDGELSI